MITELGYVTQVFPSCDNKLIVAKVQIWLFFFFLYLCASLQLFWPLSGETGDVDLNSFKLEEMSSTHISHHCIIMQSKD